MEERIKDIIDMVKKLDMPHPKRVRKDDLRLAQHLYIYLSRKNKTMTDLFYMEDKEFIKILMWE